MTTTRAATTYIETTSGDPSKGTFDEAVLQFHARVIDEDEIEDACLDVMTETALCYSAPLMNALDEYVSLFNKIVLAEDQEVRSAWKDVTFAITLLDDVVDEEDEESLCRRVSEEEPNPDDQQSGSHLMSKVSMTESNHKSSSQAATTAASVELM